MRPIPARYQLWQVMLAIAVLAGLFAWLEVTGALAILIVFGLLATPVLLAGRGRRLRATAWVASLYPMFLIGSLHATWFAAWLALGHRPRPSLDDPKFIGPVVDVSYIATFLLILGLLPSFLIGISALIADAVVDVRRSRMTGARGPALAVARMLGPLAVWSAFLVIARWNVFGTDHVIFWYMD